MITRLDIKLASLKFGVQNFNSRVRGFSAYYSFPIEKSEIFENFLSSLVL